MTNARDILWILNKHQVVLIYLSDGEDTVVQLCRALSSFVNNDIVVVTSSRKNTSLPIRNKKNGPYTLLINYCSEKSEVLQKAIAEDNPNTLKKLTEAISESLQSPTVEIILLDNISYLHTCHKDIHLIHFLHDIVARTRKTNKRLILTVSVSDTTGALSSLPLFVDQIIKV